MTAFLGVLFLLSWCIWHHLFGFWGGHLIKMWDNQWKFPPKLLTCVFFLLRKDFIPTYYHYQGLCKPTIKMFYILFFLCLGEQLFHKHHKSTARSITTKIVCGNNEANTTFSGFHASPTEAHCGQTKTREAISKCFYWPRMSVTSITGWELQNNITVFFKTRLKVIC